MNKNSPSKDLFELLQLVAHGDLTSSDVAVLLAIRQLCNGPQLCYANNQYIGQVARPKDPLTRGAVYKRIQVLMKHKLVIEEHRSNGRIHIRTKWCRWRFKEVEGRFLGGYSRGLGGSRAVASQETDCILAYNNNTCTTGPGGFFTGPEFNQEPTPWDKRAAKLYQSIKSHKYLARRTNPKSWAGILKKCYQSKGPKKFRLVFTWYLDNIGKEFVPIVRSATMFVDKFEQIAQAMERQEGPNVQITQDATSIAARHLPNATDRDVAVIQVSLNNATEMAARMVAAKNAATDTYERVDLENFIYQFMDTSPYNLIDIWVGGSRVLHTWSTDHPSVKREVDRWAGERDMEPSALKTFYRAFYGENS